MNKSITILIIKDIRSQQNLNRPKEKLRTTPRPIVDFSFGEYFVEKLLSMYDSECERVKSTIHQINSFSTIIQSIEILLMTIQEAKQIRIADYLQCLGYTPVKKQGNSLWYKSPLREETEASFKVNTELNQWYDFGIGKGGNIIALASELYRSDYVPYLLERIAKQTPHLHTANHTSFSFGRQSVSKPMFRNLQVSELSSPVLLSYLNERGINAELTKRECRELHYIYEGKPYFAIGFPNMAGGYEVRNRYFKGCVSPKDITHIRQQGEPRSMCYLFEGFMDYLSFLSIRVRNNPQCPQLTTQDYIILNSVSNLAKAEGILATYSRISCFLDNDTAGRTACEHLKAKFGERLSDKSIYYRGYKDLNDYLCGKPLSQSAEPMKQEGQVQSARRMMQPPKKRGLKM